MELGKVAGQRGQVVYIVLIRRESLSICTQNEIEEHDIGDHPHLW